MTTVSPADLPLATAPGTRPHDHELRLVAVTYEEGLATSEYVCADCGLTWFE